MFGDMAIASMLSIAIMLAFSGVAKELAIQKKETERVQLESLLQKEVMEKERKKRSNEIEMEIQIANAKADAEKQAIKDATLLKTRQMEADANKYMMEMKSEGYATLFENPQYIQLEALKSAYNNAKIVIGEIPKNSIFGLDGTFSGQTGSTMPYYYGLNNNTR